METDRQPLTVGITTRNRPDDLLRCVLSLRSVESLILEVLVVDDVSDLPTEPQLRSRLPPDFPIPIRVISFDQPDGYIVARNQIAREARSPYILYLDDDAFLLGREAVETALGILQNDDRVGAVAFAQAEADGQAWPLNAQPSAAKVRSVITSYIGFGHMLRRDVFLRLGGYRECYIYYAEEKEFCLRLLEHESKVVYLPEGLIAHVTSPIGRNSQRWLRYNIRNSFLTAMFTLPLLTLPFWLAWYTLQYFRHRRASKISDPWGPLWVFKELTFRLPEVLWTREAVKLSTYWQWRNLRKHPLPYEPATRHVDTTP